MESQRNIDKAVANAVEKEQQKSQITISELKDKIDRFMKSREELEDRCSDNAKEIMQIKQDNAIMMTSLSEQNSSLQDEILQLRSKCATQREQLSDYHEAKKRLSEADRKTDELRLALEDVTAERKAFASKTYDLELQLHELIQHRSSDFNNISNRINAAIRDELESLRDQMKISHKSTSSEVSK